MVNYNDDRQKVWSGKIYKNSQNHVVTHYDDRLKTWSQVL